jgi:hypothetical protein
MPEDQPSPQAASVHVMFRGRDHSPQDQRPFTISGFPRFPIGEPVEITEDFIRRHFRRENVRDFCEMLFGQHGFHNANRKRPWFEILDQAPVSPETPPPADVTPDPTVAPVSAVDSPAAPPSGETWVPVG